jgi:hypothetical protein
MTRVAIYYSRPRELTNTCHDAIRCINTSAFHCPSEVQHNIKLPAETKLHVYRKQENMTDDTQKVIADTSCEFCDKPKPDLVVGWIAELRIRRRRNPGYCRPSGVQHVPDMSSNANVKLQHDKINKIHRFN